jgi:hypothetical protein
MLRTVSASVTGAVGRHAKVALSHTHHEGDLPTGQFAGELASVRMTYAFSTRMFLSALFQYNSLEDSFGTNLRLNVIHRPGSDLFLVLNETRGADGDPLRLASRSGAVKVTYLTRF